MVQMLVVTMLFTGSSSPLVLDGHHLKLISIKVNSKELKVSNS